MKSRTYCSYQSSSSVCQDAFCGLNWRTSYDLAPTIVLVFDVISESCTKDQNIKIGTLVGFSNIRTSLLWDLLSV